MELKGLEQSMMFLISAGLTVGQLITDHHLSVRKWVHEQMKGTKNSFDVWHIAKGLKKKLTKVAREECEDLHLWIKSICNHLYWVAVSTPEADGALMLEKWMSLSNHIHDKHHHPGTKFPCCQHSDLVKYRRKKCLTEGTKVSVKLIDIIESSQMVKDIPMLYTGPQTASTEGFHSVVNHFAPKMIGFSYSGMLYRNILAVLHFNENSKKQQATTSDGRPQFVLAFRKAKRNFEVWQKLVDCTYDYVTELLQEVLALASRCALHEIKENMRQMAQTNPPPLCTSHEDSHPEKRLAVEQHLSRFLKKS